MEGICAAEHIPLQKCEYDKEHLFSNVVPCTINSSRLKFLPRNEKYGNISEGLTFYLFHTDRVNVMYPLHFIAL